jgi:hypothetical protein
MNRDPRFALSQELEAKQTLLDQLHALATDDPDFLTDVLEGETNLLELIAALDASIIDDETLVDGANPRIDGLIRTSDEGLASYTTIFQAIVAEGTDYTKKSAEIRVALVEKLVGAKSLDTVIQIQSEYAKTSYAAFVAHATKMGELYSDLAKAAFKPVELPFANLLGTK